MKSLHRPDLYSWSAFNPERNIDFNAVAWIRSAGNSSAGNPVTGTSTGNVLIDPLPLSDHDWHHLDSLGGAAWIVITNSDHIRAAQEIAQRTQAQIAAPLAEKATFPIACDRWLKDEEELVPGLQAIVLHGSKTSGELALLLEGTTLITGDLVRSHRAGSLTLLPNDKLQDRAEAVASIDRLAQLDQIEAVLVGDGWSIFENGHQQLQRLAAALALH
jgi:glyoxylase-like metal-dependent hydrolase (beta-lactamase superfamily II)